MIEKISSNGKCLIKKEEKIEEKCFANQEKFTWAKVVRKYSLTDISACVYRRKYVTVHESPTNCPLSQVIIPLVTSIVSQDSARKNESKNE